MEARYLVGFLLKELENQYTGIRISFLKDFITKINPQVFFSLYIQPVQSHLFYSMLVELSNDGINVQDDEFKYKLFEETFYLITPLYSSS